MKTRLWIAVVVLLGLAACNYTDGACWPVGQGGEGNAGVGSGVIVGSGAGGLGDGPSGPTSSPPCNSAPQAPATPDTGAGSSGNHCAAGAGSDEGGTGTSGDSYRFCSGPCAEACSVGGIHHFSAANFKFVTVVVDDGKDEGGGWQEAVVSLKIRRWTGWLPESWDCPLKIGAPLRSAANGKISPDLAANISAEVATSVSDSIMSSSPTIPQGIFCSLLKDQMNVMIKKIMSGSKVGLP